MKKRIEYHNKQLGGYDMKKIKQEVKNLNECKRNILLKKILSLSDTYNLTPQDQQEYIKLIDELKSLTFTPKPKSRINKGI